MTTTGSTAGTLPLGAAAASPALSLARAPRWTGPVDAWVAVALAAWGLVEVAVTPELTAVGGSAFALLSTLPLALARRFPGPVVVVVCAVLVAHAALTGAGATFTPFPSLLLAAFTVALQVAALPRAAVLGALPVAAMGAAGQFGYFGVDGAQPRAVVIAVFFVGGAWAGGRVVRHRALAAARAEEGSAAAADRAVAQERARIARELHDVVAHAVSVVVLQTGAAEQFVVRDPQRALDHLGLARRTATEAMREMRHLLDVLQEGDPSYAPQPGLGRLAELAEEGRAAGLAVDLAVTGEDEVPDGPSLAVYRLVQESLTNVLKHAPGARVAVRVAATPEQVTLQVADDGGRAGAPDLPPPGAELATGGGYGIPGMRERVRVYGGSLTAGPAEGGGWAVRAVLPLAAA
ncbi:sensor histidine kinase [Geodermatophilus sp. SYSU D00758]